MKKIVFALAAIGLMASCQSKGNKAELETESMSDSVYMVNDSTFAELQTYTYEGILPAADGPGIKYNLVIQSDGPHNDGTYTLTTTYIEAENGKDKSFTEKGKTRIIKGIDENPNAIVVQLVSDKGEKTNFLAEGESELTMVNDVFKKAMSDLNYTVTLVK